MNKGKSVTIETLNAHAASSTPNRSLKTLLRSSPPTDHLHLRSAPIETPVGPYGLDNHHLGKVLARE